MKQRIFAAILFALCLQILFAVTAEARTKTDYTLYADFLKQDEFVYRLKRKSANGLSTYGLTFYDTYGSTRYEKKSVSFCLLDINADGVKELIVARMASNWEPKAMFLYVFTIRGGRVRFVKYTGADDYCIRSDGQKLLFSASEKALYCPCTIDTSDAETERVQMSYALYRMKGLKMRRHRYAERYMEKSVGGSGERSIAYRYQKSGTKLTDPASEKTDEYESYMEENFRSTDLTACTLWRNCAKNRKKLLGKA